MDTPAIAKIREALRAVLAEAFDASIRALVESEAWYSESLDSAELLRFWILDNISKPDAQWLFLPVRSSEVRLFSDAIGLPRAEVVGKSPRELALALLRAAGFFDPRVVGRRRRVQYWEEIVQLAEDGEDEKAASVARQRAERTLRLLLYFYTAPEVGLCEHFLAVMRDPGNLRLPARLKEVLKLDPSAQPAAVHEAWLDDSMADLGFLIIAVSKLQARFDAAAVVGKQGRPIVLLNAIEQQALDGLSRALQPYAHDKPSTIERRQAELVQAARSTQAVVRDMAHRECLPDELLIVECCSSVGGPSYRGIDDRGTSIQLVAATCPPVGERVLYLCSARRDGAASWWVRSPWAPD